MVRLQYNDKLDFPDYQQDNDLWIALQDYQNADWNITIQHGVQKKNTIRMKIKRIYACWIYVSDLQRSKKFYRNIGFDMKAVDGDWIEFALGETSFAILKRPESKGEVVASKTRIMFEVEDIELVRDELESKNVKIIGNIREDPYGKLLTFEDPDGHWLEFYQGTIK